MGILLEQGKMLPEVAYVEPDQVISELKEHFPDLVAGGAGSDPSPSAKIRVYLWRPLDDHHLTKLKSLNAPEAFMVFIKAALLTGAVVASPLIFYYLWVYV